MQSGVVALAQPWKPGRNMKVVNKRVLRCSTQAVEAGHTMVGRKSVWWATGGLDSETTSCPPGVVRIEEQAHWLYPLCPWD
jgi:hypothetical protein